MNNPEGIFMLNIYIYSAWNTYLIFWYKNEAKVLLAGALIYERRSMLYSYSI